MSATYEWYLIDNAGRAWSVEDQAEAEALLVEGEEYGMIINDDYYRVGPKVRDHVAEWARRKDRRNAVRRAERTERRQLQTV